MINSKITIIDYGLGNLFSIARALKHIGSIPEISSDPQKISLADRLILPGVGAFKKGMDELDKKGISEAIMNFIDKERPLLGICLGMQLLMTKSYEFGLHDGLDLIKGEVIKFNSTHNNEQGFKIPHIGWEKIQPVSDDEGDINTFSWYKTPLENMAPESFFYFVHSYHAVPENKNHILAESSYAGEIFCSVIKKDNLLGCQFHPERSGPVGLKLLENFCMN